MWHLTCFVYILGLMTAFAGVYVFHQIQSQVMKRLGKTGTTREDVAALIAENAQLKQEIEWFKAITTAAKR